MFTEKEVEEVKNYLTDVEGKVYLGCDSKRWKRNGEWFATYTLVIVVHKDNSKGCKIFGTNSTERDYTSQKNKPSLRLMNEVYKVTQLYLDLEPILRYRDVEVHLDINPKKQYASNEVVAQAVGYVRGVTPCEVMIKPEAFAASYAADNLVRLAPNCSRKSKRALKKSGKAAA